MSLQSTISDLEDDAALLPQHGRALPGIKISLVARMKPSLHFLPSSKINSNPCAGCPGNPATAEGQTDRKRSSSDISFSVFAKCLEKVGFGLARKPHMFHAHAFPPRPQDNSHSSVSAREASPGLTNTRLRAIIGQVSPSFVTPESKYQARRTHSDEDGTVWGELEVIMHAHSDGISKSRNRSVAS